MEMVWNNCETGFQNVDSNRVVIQKTGDKQNRTTKGVDKTHRGVF